MEVTLDIPDELAAQIISEGKDPSRTALEALALEGYSTEQISEAEIRRLLGFEPRMEVHAFLKEHGAFLHYSLEDAEKDRETALRVRTKRLQIPAVEERRAG
jgi:predicted HTH domain antitoxin